MTKKHYQFRFHILFIWLVIYYFKYYILDKFAEIFKKIIKLIITIIIYLETGSGNEVYYKNEIHVLPTWLP